jgi:hypothetical protein
MGTSQWQHSSLRFSEQLAKMNSGTFSAIGKFQKRPTEAAASI